MQKKSFPCGHYSPDTGPYIKVTSKATTRIHEFSAINKKYLVPVKKIK